MLSLQGYHSGRGQWMSTRSFGGSRREDEKQLILENLVLNWYAPGYHYKLPFNILEFNVCIDVFKAEGGNMSFTIQGHEVPTGIQIGPHTNSERAFERTRKWLHECLRNHKCPKPGPRGPHPLPKRLIEVRGSSKDSVRLVETQGDEYPYACLSYRSGSPEHRRLKTTARNIQDHLYEIPWEHLPATFRDAATICRRMDVRYIWIDSLCILQDFDGIAPDEVDTTRQDFVHENAAMARTYRNSYFTISADISTNMDSGIFSTVPIDCQRIEVDNDDGATETIYFREKLDHVEVRPPDLETRGWTFQEFLLPPRVLHFGPFDVEWRCRERHTCECRHLDFEKTKGIQWHRHHKLAEIAANVPENEDEASEWWKDVVHAYSERDLTNASDKLPALSGMAQLHRQACRDTYLAGLWKGSLVHDLCWYYQPGDMVSRLRGTSRRPREYRAPSWSWASLDVKFRCYFWRVGRIGRHISHQKCPADMIEPVCKIFEAFCQPKIADAMGEVGYGFLDIEAVLISAKIGPCLWNDYNEVETPWTTTDNIDTNLSISFFKPDCELVDDDLSIGGIIYYVLILEVVLEDGLQRGCLVLKKLYTNLYQRIGFCVLKGDFHVADGIPNFNAQDYALPDNKARIIII